MLFTRRGLIRSLHTDAYTINAIGQDDFEDVKVPDVPVNGMEAAKK